MDFSSILSHPERDEIVSKLLTGSDPKDVSQWLKLKYAEKSQTHLRLSIKILQDFSKSQYMNYYDQFKQDLVAEKSDNSKLDKKVADSLYNNKTYKERLNEVAEKEINIRERFLSLDLMIRDRIEQVFDKIQEDPGSFKGDYVFIKYVEQYLSLIEKYNRDINNAPDQIIQHNHTVQYVDQNLAAMQDGIREALLELDPELTALVMEKISDAMSRIKPPAELPLTTQDERLGQIKDLQEAIVIKEVK